MPSARLTPLFTTLPAGTQLIRAHALGRRPDQFVPGLGNTRFAPLRLESGFVPHLYLAESVEAAIYEGPLHDLDFDQPDPQIEFSALSGWTLSVLATTQDLKLVDLCTPGLNRLRLHRRQLIDTSPTDYPHTRIWAQALHAAGARQGLTWTSRLDDRSRSFVIYGDPVREGKRPPSAPLLLGQGPLPLALPPLRELLEKVCQDSGVTIIS